MRFLTKAFLIIIGISLISLECSNKATSEDLVEWELAQPIKPHAKWNDFWYSGKAELTSYELKQSRYGQIHDGHAVLVFVTEPFSKEKQVKLDRPGRAGDDNVSVLKLNLTKKFNTGIYPYSLMQSVFTPVDVNTHPNTIKTSMSGQEWCGHVFNQMNLENDNYLNTSFSYFESEGDTKYKVKKAFLEDEIWTRIRISPSSLPTGELSMIPGSLPSRLLHRELAPEVVTAEMNSLFNGLQEYKIKYKKSGRELKIHFTKEFPYEIEGWEETYENPFNGKNMTTKATKMKSLRGPYWSQHGNEHLYLRDSLALPR